jgi:hypothetical protein
MLTPKPNGNVVDLEVELTAGDVLRLLADVQHAPVSNDLAAAVDRLLGEVSGLWEARGTYVVYDVDHMTDTELSIDSSPPINGPISKFLRPARRVAVFAVTIGDAIEKLAAERRRAGAKLDARVLSAIGSAAVDNTTDALANAVFFEVANPDESLSAPLCPGCCGLSEAEHETLYGLVDAKAIGITLLPTMRFRPSTSTTGMLGIGDAVAFREHGVPCHYCSVRDCRKPPAA